MEDLFGKMSGKAHCGQAGSNLNDVINLNV
jgi:hypothetical protein